MNSSNSFALNRIKDLCWALAIAAVVVGIGRFAFGLGASTNMMDTLPWGLWKIFNMVAGAALATSGFVIAAVIYIFQIDRYRPVARLSVIVGFLGYSASLCALIFDIGLPHRGWHPFVMWNPHSFLFEVFWCVSCYWAVTALELIPVLSERFPLKKFTHFMHEVMLPFIVLGVTLSTMHHSSLGSLFLASPTRLHPLWHSMWIPPEFFISAMGAGLSTIVLLYVMACKLYRKPWNTTLIRGMAGLSAIFLGLFLIIRVIDLTLHNKWGYVFGPEMTWESYVFMVEFALQAIIPVMILGVPKFRKNIPMVVFGASCAFLGLIMHRMDVGIVGYFTTSNAVYIPNISEFILSFGVLGGAGLLFFFFIERALIFDDSHTVADEAKSAHDGHDGHGADVKLWTWSEARSILTGSGASRVVLIAILVLPMAWMGLKHQATGAFEPIKQPVARPIALDEMRTDFKIDGNRSAEYAFFPHELHKFKLAGEGPQGIDDSCVKCHHLDLPNDHGTGCSMCHVDMEVPNDIFDHEGHQERHGGDDSCVQCHTEGLDQGVNTAKACIECHKDNMGGLVAATQKGFSHVAPGYKNAMHGSCKTCHRLHETDPKDPMSLGNCLGCHKPIEGEATKTE